MIDFVQNRGETIFVPVGWHHIVLNLEWTVAITHNFISEAQLDHSFAHLAARDPEGARAWHRCLLEKQPELAARVKPP